MQEIKAIIRPERLDEVLHALRAMDVPGVTVSTVTGYGRSRPTAEAGPLEFQPFTKVEIVVDDSIAAQVVSSIERAAHTGRSGDGKIFVLPVAEAIRVRSGARGAEAL